MEASQAAGSAKFVALYGPPTDVAAFERYYAATHLPLVHALVGLQRFEAALVLGTADGGTAPYYRVAELCSPLKKASGRRRQCKTLQSQFTGALLSGQI